MTKRNDELDKEIMKSIVSGVRAATELDNKLLYGFNSDSIQEIKQACFKHMAQELLGEIYRLRWEWETTIDNNSKRPFVNVDEIKDLLSKYMGGKDV